jgi:enoyl-CoA hydratase/carnithine racemase
MGSLVRYDFDGSVARITMNDGKVNVLSPEMLAELNEALSRAEADAAIVALAGRPGVFSAGFDLKVLRAGGPGARIMLRAGFELAERMLSFPMPVVIACTGHAVAMGAFLVLSGDYRIGVAEAAEFDQELATVLAGIAQLDMTAHAATKLRVRKQALTAIHEAIQLEAASYAA